MAYTFKHGDRPLDDFVIQRAVGRGGFGEVYYAVSDGGREVALKYLRENPHVELRGVSHCMNLKSPHLVTIFDVKKSADDEYFIVMEYVSGPSLRDLLVAEPKGLGPQKAAFFIREIAKGLAYLHDRGIVHRDLKPGNIFYEEGYVKIGDYGLSKFISVSRHSAQTASVGTVHYMAPEIGTGNYHRGIDVYAMGVMLYEMLLGKVPFEGSSFGEVLMKHLTEQPEVDSLPQPFGKVIRKALQKDPKDRYQNIYEMVDDLLEVQDVKESLAGFNPASLSGAVRKGIADEGWSPSPSPNPAPGPGPAAWPKRTPSMMDVRRLPASVEKRLVKTSEKVEERMRKLEAKHGAPPHKKHAKPVEDKPRRPGVAHQSARTSAEVMQRAGLAAAMALGLGTVIGMAAGGMNRPEMMIAPITMILGLSGGVLLGCRLVPSLTRDPLTPNWVTWMCLTGGAAIPLFATATPLIAFREEAGLATVAALLVTTLILNWRKRISAGTHGQLSIGSAITAAITGGILTAIFTEGRPEQFSLIGGGVAAASSLVVQALAWLFPLREWINGRPAALWQGTADEVARPAPPAARRVWEDDSGAANTLTYPGARPVEVESPPDRIAVADPQRLHEPFVVDPGSKRWGVTRVTGGLLGFASLVAIIGVFLTFPGSHSSTRVSRSVTVATNGGTRIEQVWSSGNEMDMVGAAAAAGGLFGLMLLFFRKTTRVRTGGFYRDTLRPVLIAVALAGVSGSVAAQVLASQSRQDGMDGSANMVVGWVVGTICMILLFTLLVVRGQKHEPRWRRWDPSSAAASPQPAGAGDAADQHRPTN